MDHKRHILITGGTGKIGRIITQSALDSGHSVVVGTRDPDKARQLFDQRELRIQKLDLMEDIDLNDLIPYQIDMVIHCARNLDSLMVADGLEVADKFWDMEWRLGVSGPYEITRQLWCGHSLRDVVFISSMYGVVGPTPSLYENFASQSPIQYGVVKAAQQHLTKELSIRFAPVRVNCISYGGFEGRTDKAFEERYCALNPMNRMLNERDVFAPIKMLIEDREIAITGQNIQVDGGWTVW